MFLLSIIKIQPSSIKKIDISGSQKTNNSAFNNILINFNQINISNVPCPSDPKPVNFNDF